MKVWVSKYALTKLTDGVYETEAVIAERTKYVYEQPGLRFVSKLGFGAHETREAAVADAEKRRTARIASLRRQIARLEKLSFEETLS